jgi:heme oxygenase
VTETATTLEASETGFAARLRTATFATHQQAAGSGFLVNLVAGHLGLAAYADLLGQYWTLYSALEAAVERHRGDPVLVRVAAPELERRSALESDLAALHGPAWAAALDPLPATTAYAHRLSDLAEVWPAGLLAHHYVRYLGDLSGGLMIGRALEAADWINPDALAFWRFEQIADPAAFKARYRELLDETVPATSELAERLVAEVLCGYELNSTVLAELDARHPRD